MQLKSVLFKSQLYCMRFHFIDEETGITKGLNHLPRSHCKCVAKPRSTPRPEAKAPDLLPEYIVSYYIVSN